MKKKRWISKYLRNEKNLENQIFDALWYLPTQRKLDQKRNFWILWQKIKKNKRFLHFTFFFSFWCYQLEWKVFDQSSLSNKTNLKMNLKQKWIKFAAFFFENNWKRMRIDHHFWKRKKRRVIYKRFLLKSKFFFLLFDKVVFFCDCVYIHLISGMEDLCFLGSRGVSKMMGFFW